VSGQFRDRPDADGWDRRAFAMTAAETEVQEAIQVLARLIDGQAVSLGTRRALERSLRALRSECEDTR
jgi:uncharacterized protein (UPF0147 family)